MLWLIEDPEAVSCAALAPFLPLLSVERRERIARYRYEPAKTQAILAGLLLRYALREEYGLREVPRIEAGKAGKPFFPERPELRFNLSHCKKAVACALDASPVGVDVQELRSFPRDPAHPAGPSVYRVLSETERAWVEAGESPAEQDRRFSAVWTCKEAYGKALGLGVLYELRQTAFVPKSSRWEQQGFVFQSFGRGGYHCTLCSAAGLEIKALPASALPDLLSHPKQD